MALAHARTHARLKEDHFVELRKHRGWYLGHFPGAKQVRNKNELVHINHLRDVEPIIQQALEQPATLDNENDTTPLEEVYDPELDLSAHLLTDSPISIHKTFLFVTADLSVSINADTGMQIEHTWDYYS